MEGWGERSLSSYFDELKSAQVAGFFMSKNKGRMNYMKLIKLMYLADRMSFELYGRPITGDELFNLEHGQILSKTLDLIKQKVEGKFFSNFFSRPRGYNITIENDPRTSELSKADLEILESIFENFGNYSQWNLELYCHKLPEWENPGNSCIPIPYERLMKVLKFSDEEINQSLEYISQWSS